uniref:Kit ligand n=1 Tax=Varanus komodoensis TaxID=61221 RepID=A0A8D2Q7V4_VARKO
IKKTWIITCFYLQLLLLNPLVKAQSRCGNPVTDDVNNIGKLVGNLPNDYMIPLKYVRKMDSLSFRQHNDHLYEEGKFIPAEFFEHFYNIISVYNIFAKSQVQSDCVLPSTTETLSNDSSIHATNPFLLHPVEASSLRNASISSDTNKTELDFLSGPSMQGISIALTSMVTLFIGFILGALCWKVRNIKFKYQI